MNNLHQYITERLKLSNKKTYSYIDTFDEFIEKYKLQKCSVNQMCTFDNADNPVLKNPNLKYIIDKGKDIDSTQLYKDLLKFIKDNLELKNYFPDFFFHGDDIELFISTFQKDVLVKVYIWLVPHRGFVQFDYDNKEKEQYIIQIVDYIMNYKL